MRDCQLLEQEMRDRGREREGEELSAGKEKRKRQIKRTIV